MRIRCSNDQQRLMRVQKLCSAATLNPHPSERHKIEDLIRKTVDAMHGEPLDLTHLYPRVADPHILTAAILKPPVGPLEKGVLLISFQKHWSKLLRLSPT
jgi:hypothetical protein